MASTSDPTMIKILFSLFLLLTSVVLQAQTNYIAYHKEAREIEELILDSSYSEAIEAYKTLFDQYDFVFAEDAYRATQTATFINDTTNAFLFLKRSIKGGITMKRVSSDSLLIKLKAKAQWEKFELNYDTLRSQYSSGINWELRAKINQLYDLDQKYRDKHELHPWNFLWRPLIWIKWKNVTRKIVENELIPLIQEFGFPNERLIGLDEATFHRKHKRDHIKSSHAFIILIHYFSVPRTTAYNDLLYSALETGNISPKQYASLIDFQVTSGKGKYFNGLPYKEWWKYSVEEDNKINSNRKAIGLESLETKKRKYDRGLEICKRSKNERLKLIRFWIFCG